MFSFSAKIKTYDARRLESLLLFVVEHTNKKIGNMVKQSAILAIRSAAIATSPGSSNKVSKLEKQYRLRPILNKDKFGARSELFFYKRPDGEVFSSSFKLRPKTMKREGVIMAKKGFWAWSKLLNRWIVKPYWGTKTTFDDSVKDGRIPSAGAAKAGWLKGLSFFGSFSDSGNFKSKQPMTAVKSALTGKKPFALISNLVSYVSKTSPDSALKGINAAGQAIKHKYIPQLSQELQNKWRS